VSDDGRALTGLVLVGLAVASALRRGSRAEVRQGRGEPVDRTIVFLGKPGTRLRELEEEALEAGMIVRTDSPGDGMTRYRFFNLADMARQAEEHGKRDWNPNDQRYYGGFGQHTAHGIKKAWAFVREAPRAPWGSRATVRQGRKSRAATVFVIAERLPGGGALEEGSTDPLFWNNEGGFEDLDSAARYSEEEREQANLPISGAWEDERVARQRVDRWNRTMRLPWP
jgi:hypothetical protein